VGDASLENAMSRVLAVAVVLSVVPARALAQPEPTEDATAPQKEEAASDAEEPDKEANQPRGDDEEPTKSAAPAAVSQKGMIEVGGPKAKMTLPGGTVLINAIVEANMAKGATAKPLGVAPDLWFGIADRLTFGIVHSGRGATGFLTGYGTGLCLNGGGSGMGSGMGGGMANPCSQGLGKIYTFAGADLRIGLAEGGFALAFVLGGQATAFKPKLTMSGKAGLLARIQGNRIALEFAPTGYAGITQRKIDDGTGTQIDNPANLDELGMPVTLFLRLSRSFSLALQGGITFTIKDAANTYKVPAAAGLSWWVTPKFSLDAAFGLAAVVDKDTMTKPFDSRSATVGVGLAL
jgi:hypothetical protein